MGEIAELADLGIHVNYSDLMADICDYQVENTEYASQILDCIDTLASLQLLLIKSRKENIAEAKVHDYLAESYLVITKLSMLYGESHVTDSLDLKLKRYAWTSMKEQRGRDN